MPLRRGRGQAQAGRDSPPTRPVGGNGKTKWPQAVPLLRAGSIPALPKLFLPGSVGERQGSTRTVTQPSTRNILRNLVSQVFLHHAFARPPCRGRTSREFFLHFSRQAKGVTKHGILRPPPWRRGLRAWHWYFRAASMDGRSYMAADRKLRTGRPPFFFWRKEWKSCSTSASSISCGTTR